MKRYYTTDENLILKYSYENAPKTLDELFDLFLKAWTIDTCAPRLRNKWTKDNPTVGQCSITAFIIQDFFGGMVYGIKLDDGNFHCFNVIDNVIIDFTCEQFGKNLEYNVSFPQDKNIHFLKEEKYQRYLILKNRLLKKYSNE